MKKQPVTSSARARRGTRPVTKYGLVEKDGSEKDMVNTPSIRLQTEKGHRMILLASSGTSPMRS
jgi:hypothetical protein